MAQNNPYAQHIKTGRAQLRRLTTMERHLLDMSADWGDLDAWLEPAMEQWAGKLKELTAEINGVMDTWKRGNEWEE